MILVLQRKTIKKRSNHIRFLHENSFEFSLQAKIFIDTNHLPNVTDQTLFESGRIKIISFNRHFEEHEQDKTLKTTLADPENLSGILNWAVEGYRLYKREGLEEPDDVKSATAQYRQDSDRISQFVEAWLEEGTDTDFCSARRTGFLLYKLAGSATKGPTVSGWRRGVTTTA